MKLTKRQQQILSALCDGYTIPETAECLDIQAKSVRTYLESARKSNRLKTNFQLVAIFAQELKNESK